jgi:hypothetical protein
MHHVAESTHSIAARQFCLMATYGCNIAANWVALLIRIWEILNSDLGLETNCPY